MTSREAYELALRNGSSKELEEYISKDSGYSCAYARDVLKGPFPAGEAAIAQDTYSSYSYVRNILKGPFPAGEAAIAQDTYPSYDYARLVLKGPFPLGEAAIARDFHYSYYYARDVLFGPFPAGEAAISKDIKFGLDYQFRFNRDICLKEQLSKFPAHALSYAIMKNGRFPEGEPAMKKSPRIWKKYLEFIDDTTTSICIRVK